MSTASTWSVIAGNYGYPINISIYASSGSAKDLTDYTQATLKIWEAGSTADFLSTIVTILSPATQGIVQYTIGETDFPTGSAGTYWWSVILTNLSVGAPTEESTLLQPMIVYPTSPD
jgi:hypothetical protein